MEWTTKLKQLRARKHWTQQQAAGFIGVDKATYRRWEYGETTPRATSIKQICDAFGISVDELGLTVDETPQALHPDISTMIGTDFTMKLLAVVFGPYKQCQSIQNAMTQLIEEDSMTSDTFGRRDALRRVATLPLLTLGLNPTSPATAAQRSPEETLKQCAAGITACWELSKGDDESDLNLAFKGASAYLPALKAIVDESAKYRKEAANLAGQCALLQCLLAWHLHGLPQAIAHGEEAVTYAKEAGDIPMLLSTLDYLAWAHYYNKHAKTALKVINYAVPHLKTKGAPLSPHLLGGVYSTIALMSAKNGIQGTPSLRQAAEHFFIAPETDDRLVYMDYTRGDLLLNDGMVHYHQGDYEPALDSLSQLIDPETLQAKIPLPERSRVEGLNFMTLASLKAKKKDMEWSLRTWKTAITEATKLRSEQRFGEAVTAYDIMEGIWSDEKRVKELRELVTHW